MNKLPTLAVNSYRTIVCAFVLLAFAWSPSAFAIGGGWGDWEGSTNYNNVGGQSGPTITVTDGTHFMVEVTNTTPRIIEVQGSITVGSTLGSSDTRITNNKTIVGVGTNAMITGCLATFYATNIIFRNLTLANTGQGDKDAIRTSYHGLHIWIDHCTFVAGPDTLLDITHAADLQTVTYCIFSNDVEACLVGHSDSNASEDTGHLNVTWNHNWWTIGATERMPRVRFGKNHVYNNYYSSTGALYNIGVGVFCQLLVENDYFDNSVANGTSTWAQYSTSSSNQGQIHWNNGSVYTDGTSIATWATNSIVFTPPYSYSLDDGITVKGMVVDNAGADKLPVAEFSASPTSGTAPLPVTFTDSSTGFPYRLDITNRFWDFGDGSTTNTTNNSLSHVYSNSGTYTVALTVTSLVGSNTQTRSGYIVATGSSAPPVASFTDAPATNGAAPLNVNFTDTSTGSPTSWAWNFGGDGTSTAQNPAHTFANPGAYSVQLIASNADGSSTNTVTSHVYAPYAWWELSYFIATNAVNGAPGVDATGTGMLNTNKFLAGFNPTNSASYLHIISIVEQLATGNTNVIVTYLGPNGDNTYTPGIASRTNVLDYMTGDASGNYTNGGWQDTGQTNILNGGNGSGIVTNMADTAILSPSTNRYYRVRGLLP